MAYATVELTITPEDGWVLAATNPAYLYIKPGYNIPWYLAVTTSGAPVTDDSPATVDLVFSNNPSSTQTVTLDGRVYTVLTAFDPDEPEADAFLLGGNAEATIDNLVAVVNGRAALPAEAATGTITISGGVPTADDTVTVGDDTYTFKASASLAFEVTIGGDAEATGEALTIAINTDGTSGVTATDGAAGVVNLEADTAGAAGNAIVLTEDADNTTVSGTGTLSGGREIVAAVTAHATLTAAKSAADTATFTAKLEGESGNAIAVSETLSNAAFDGGATSLSGGVEPVRGLMMQGPCDDPKQPYEKVGATTAEFYIRVGQGAQPEPGQGVRFGIIRDQS